MVADDSTETDGVAERSLDRVNDIDKLSSSLLEMLNVRAIAGENRKTVINNPSNSMVRITFSFALQIW